MQIQKLLQHKDSHRIKVWLNDLLEKKCISQYGSKKTFNDYNSPNIYYLTKKARKILKEKNIPVSQLGYIYDEHTRVKLFVDRCIFLADVYIFLMDRKKKEEQIKFFTTHELTPYEYFPKKLPSAFIAVSSGATTQRYFLEYFDETVPKEVPPYAVKKYVEYAKLCDWDENTDFAPFPAVLVVLPNDTRKQHVYHYSKELLDKTYDDKVQVFLTTKNMIKFAQNTDNIWQKVEW